MKIFKRIIVTGVLLAGLVPVLGLTVMSVMSQNKAPPGVKAGALVECPDSPNCVCSQTESSAHRVSSIPFSGSPQTAMSQMSQVLSEIPRATFGNRTASYLHVVMRSVVFRFPDDVELLLDEHSKLFHIRSASRVGESDLGVNRERVETIARRFKQLNSSD